MDTQNPSVPPRARSADGGSQSHARATQRPPARPDAHRRRTAARPSGIAHDNTRHTTRFTVIGNHLTQHPELSLLAIGLACHIQSLPAGARADIKTLAARFPEGTTRIAAALRELEAHGYLRRERERTPAGRIVTRTISCNQPGAARNQPPPAAPTRTRPSEANDHPAPHPAPRKQPRPLPAVPHPAYPAPALLQQAADLLAELRHHDPRLLLSAHDTAHLAPGVAAWLERDVEPVAVRHALTRDLPPEGPRRPAALLAHRLAALLPPPPPFRSPAAAPPPARHPLHNCDSCDRAFRAPAPGRCRDCRPTPIRSH
ncbi:helix-turn-helix domain-containing protein [Streptomyces sp. NPDC006627]|uniref:helix-turn-helix domain-containing protein n=1 Tax=Streptomyces sp. NPDC006627 TaxID=3154679 RepID=UPI0033AA1DB2